MGQKKYTAVEWLRRDIESNFLQLTEGFLTIQEFMDEFDNIIKEAKQKEENQIFESWDSGFDNGNYYGKYNENCEINSGEQYYNETYNN